MLKLNSELRAQAREALRGKWPMAAVAALIYSAIAGGLSAIPVIGGLCSLFVGLPVAYGFTIVMLGVCRGKDIDFGVLFEGFQDYGRIFVTMLLQAVYTILWSLLLVIPGIIKSYSYAMTSFTLGIGLLFLQPYVAISRAAFYEDLKAQQGGSVEVNVEVNVEI